MYIPLNFWLCTLSRSLSIARSLFSSAAAAGASGLHIKVSGAMRRHCMTSRTTQRQLTCRTLLYELLEYLLGTFEVSLLAEGLTSAVHSLIVLRILRKRLLGRLLRACPILALDVARRHVCVRLLYEVICLLGTRSGGEHCTLPSFSCARNMKCTSVRSFGAAAVSMGPAFITDDKTPDLRNRKGDDEMWHNGRCGILNTTCPGLRHKVPPSQ